MELEMGRESEDQKSGERNEVSSQDGIERVEIGWGGDFAGRAKER
jgi:hypothetical protein